MAGDDVPKIDLSPLAYFKELHLLPRVIFTIGGILFVASLFSRLVDLGLFGLGIIFAAVAMNLFIDAIYHAGQPPYGLKIWWGGIFQSFLALAISLFCLYIAIYMYRYGFLPNKLQPLPKPPVTNTSQH